MVCNYGVKRGIKGWIVVNNNGVNRDVIEVVIYRRKNLDFCWVLLFYDI